ncbi:MAG: ABC transporter permease [Dehalococcoidia bacterium]
MAVSGEQVAALDAAVRRGRKPWYVDATVRLVREKPLGAVGAAIVLLFVLVAVFAEPLATYPYERVHLADTLLPPGTPGLDGTPTYYFGTDNLGRDVYSRIVYGARVSMTVALGAVGLGMFFAILLGTLSGYLRGTFDLIIQRVVDAWISIPFFILLLTIMMIFKPGIGPVIFALALAGTFSNSRVVRSAVLTTMTMPYIEAARCTGAHNVRIILRHVLPNIIAPIIVVATLGLGNVILAESALSFLGLGVPPPYPTWGQMLSGSSRVFMYEAPWLAVVPGVAITLAVFGFNMFGDALRDLLDPRLRGSR